MNKLGGEGRMNAKQIWQAALGELQIKVPGPSFQTWLKNTSIAQYEEGKWIAIAVPSNFAKEWLEKKYSKQIAETLRNVLGRDVEVRFEVRTPARGDNSRGLHALDGVGDAKEMELPVAVGQSTSGPVVNQPMGSAVNQAHGHSSGDPTPIRDMNGQMGSNVSNIVRPQAPGVSGMSNRGGAMQQPQYIRGGSGGGNAGSSVRSAV